MVNLEWCKKKERGIRMIEPNDNLCKEYLESSEETLSILKEIQGKLNMWLATTKYYCEYFAVYSLLMKIGIKSEIHDCTIALAEFLEKENLLPKGTYKNLEKDKRLRIDNQYYLKNINVEIVYSELTNFILEIKDIINSLTFDKINEIRKEIK